MALPQPRYPDWGLQEGITTWQPQSRMEEILNASKSVLEKAESLAQRKIGKSVAGSLVASSQGSCVPGLAGSPSASEVVPLQLGLQLPGSTAGSKQSVRDGSQGLRRRLLTQKFEQSVAASKFGASQAKSSVPLINVTHPQSGPPNPLLFPCANHLQLNLTHQAPSHQTYTASGLPPPYAPQTQSLLLEDAHQNARYVQQGSPYQSRCASPLLGSPAALGMPVSFMGSDGCMYFQHPPSPVQQYPSEGYYW